MKKKVILLVILLLCIANVGCSKKEKSANYQIVEVPDLPNSSTEIICTVSEETTQDIEPPTPLQAAPAVPPTDGDILLSDDNHMSVVDTPSKNGCTVLPALRSQEGGRVAWRHTTLN